VSLRTRAALGTAALLSIGIATALITAYSLVRQQLEGQVDRTLSERAHAIAAVSRSQPPPAAPPPARFKIPPVKFGEPDSYVQFVSPNGKVTLIPGEQIVLPAERAIAVARRQRTANYSDATVSGKHLRIYTAAVASGAVEVARPLTDVDNALGWIKLAFSIISAGAILATAVLGWFLSRATLRPVARLTAAAERIAATGDLSAGTDETRPDELGRLARSFNSMLRALDQSRHAQRQLVADASHELRTPLTTARASLESLELHPDLDAAVRLRYLETAIAELKEMTQLIDELVALAQGDAQPPEKELVRLDEIVDAAIATAARRADHEFLRSLEPTEIFGAPNDLSRAVGNLLDNAVKWSPPQAAIEVDLRDGVLSVRDRGPGVAPEDQSRIFDRFYRAAAARTKRGSGLGLAIVRQAAIAHGGTTGVVDAPGGGSTFTLDLAAARPNPIGGRPERP